VQTQSKENPLQLEVDAHITEETASYENRFRIRDDTPGICGRERQLLTVTKLVFQPSKIMIVRERKGDLKRLTVLGIISSCERLHFNGGCLLLSSAMTARAAVSCMGEKPVL